MLPATAQRILHSPQTGFLLATLASMAVYAIFGFQGWLYRDDAIYLYAGQQLAEGVPPYQSVYDHKTPLAPILTGLSIAAGRAVGADDVLAARLLFWLLSGLCGGVLWLLAGRLWGSHLAGWLASLALTGFWTFGREAASGPQAKTPMVLFHLTFLHFAASGRWMAAGAAAALATWTWQPGIFFTAVACGAPLLNGRRPWRQRWRDAKLAAIGVVIPSLILFGYFAMVGAFGDLLDGSIFFNFLYLDQPPFILTERILAPLYALVRGFTLMAPLAIAGFAYLLLHGHLMVRDAVLRDRDWPAWAAVYLSLPFPVFWTIGDFQGAADLYPFLAYFALGTGGLLWRMSEGIAAAHAHPLVTPRSVGIGVCLLLALSSALLYASNRERMLGDQRYSAQLIRQQLGSDARLATIGAPEALVLLGERNPNRYLFLIRGVDARVVAETPGGAEGFILQLAQHGVRGIVVGETDGRHRDELFAALARYYQKVRIGYFDVYARNNTPLPDSD